MDFIERWFGVSPDGGDGSLEVLYLLVIAAIAAAIVHREPLLRALRSNRKRQDKPSDKGNLPRRHEDTKPNL